MLRNLLLRSGQTTAVLAVIAATVVLGAPTPEVDLHALKVLGVAFLAGLLLAALCSLPKGTNR